MKQERYESIINELDAIFKRHTGGWADEEALTKIESSINAIHYGAEDDPYIDNKASELKRLASVLYSVRKHQKWQRDGEAGVLVVRSQIASVIHALRSWPQTRENMERVFRETKNINSQA